MKGEETAELELSLDELVDVALDINYAQGFDLNVDLHSVDVDDVACEPGSPHPSLRRGPGEGSPSTIILATHKNM